MKETLNSKLYILVVIGIVSAFGPFVTDFYLPALPVLAGYFDTTASLVQLSLTFSMVGLAVGQLVIGPLSDKYGRKKPLMASLVLFCISTIGCLYASDIYVFIFFRLFPNPSPRISTKGESLPAFFPCLAPCKALPRFVPPYWGVFYWK